MPVNEMREDHVKPQDNISLGRLIYLSVGGCLMLFVLVYATIIGENIFYHWWPTRILFFGVFLLGVVGVIATSIMIYSRVRGSQDNRNTAKR